MIRAVVSPLLLTQTLPNNPAFLARKSADSTNATGNGANFTIICDSEQYDRGSVHDNTTGLVTAPVASLWQFNCTFSCLNTPTGIFCKLVTTNRTYRGVVGRPSNSASAGGDYIISFSEQPDMSAGDTAKLEITGTGLAGDTATVTGGAASQFCHWSGRIVG